MRGDRHTEQLHTSRDGWRPVLGGPVTPAEHSSLAADDQIFPALPPSTIVWTALNLSVHHFDRALGALDRNPRSTTTQVDPDIFPCLRASLLHASTALAVLSPGRVRRIDHALRIAWTAFSGTGSRSTAALSLVPFPNELVASQAQSLLTDRSFTARPTWTDLSSVRVAAAHMRDRVAEPDLFEATIRHLWEDEQQGQAVLDDAMVCAVSVAAVIQRCLTLWQARVAVVTDDEAPTTPGAPAQVAPTLGAPGLPVPARGRRVAVNTDPFTRTPETVVPPAGRRARHTPLQPGLLT